jgi:hypothetical protein
MPYIPNAVISGGPPGQQGATGPGSATRTLASSSIAGATSVTVNLAPVAPIVDEGLIAIDAYTTECEVRSIASIAGAVITLDSALKFAHASTDVVIGIEDRVSTDLYALMADGTDEWGPLQRAVLDTTEHAVLLAGRAATSGRLFSVSQPVLVPTQSHFWEIGMQTRTATYAPVDAAGGLCMVGNKSFAFSASAATNVFTSVGTSGLGTYDTTNDSKIVFNAPYGESLPGGITAGKVYYVDTVPSPSTFTVSATPGGSTLDISGDGTGWCVAQMDDLCRTYWDNVRFDLTVADVNGLRIANQQPGYIRNLRIEMDAAATAPPVYGAYFGARTQLNYVYNAEVNTNTDCTGIFLSGGGNNICGFNDNGVGDGDVGIEVAGSSYATTLSGLWTEAMGTAGVLISGESRGLNIEGGWVSTGAGPALKVTDGMSTYEVGTIYCVNSTGYILEDTVRGYTLYPDQSASGTRHDVVTDFHYVFPGWTQLGYPSGDEPAPTFKTRFQSKIVFAHSPWLMKYIDEYVRVDTSSGAITVRLGEAAGWRGHSYRVHHYAGAGAVTVETTGSETIDGNATATVPLGMTYIFQSDGTNYTTMGVSGDPETYSATNVTPDRSYDADTVLIAELADVVGTLIADLRTKGIVL